MKYTFAFGDYKVIASFQTIKRLRAFLKTVPEHELKNSVVLKHRKDGVSIAGQFVRNEKIIVF